MDPPLHGRVLRLAVDADEVGRYLRVTVETVVPLDDEVDLDVDGCRSELVVLVVVFCSIPSLPDLAV